MASDISTTNICNMALSHLGISSEIQSLDTDRSQEGSACRQFFDTARKTVLRDFAWPFAKKMIALGLVANQPNQFWAYSYQYPSDCLHFLRVMSCIYTDTRQSRVPYEIVYGTAGQEIWTNQDTASGEYTVDVIDTSRFPPDFIIPLSLRLAGYISPRLTAGDPYKLGQRAMQLYDLEIARARASAVNEVQESEDPDSEFIRGRS